MTLTLSIVVDNVYGDDTITNEYQDVEVEHPESDADLDEWAYDNLWPHTGTGRTHGEAGYFVKITKCEDRPDLVDQEFEWFG